MSHRSVEELAFKHNNAPPSKKTNQTNKKTILMQSCPSLPDNILNLAPGFQIYLLALKDFLEVKSQLFLVSIHTIIHTSTTFRVIDQNKIDQILSFYRPWLPFVIL